MNKKPILYFLILVLLSTACGRYPGNKDTGTKEVSTEKKGNKQDSDAETISFDAKISRVVDGDTVEILYHELTLTVRMEHIDAPESWGNQAYGEAAKKLLAKLILGKTLTVKTQGEFDGYGRLIAELFLNSTNINKEMVRLGYAWHFKKYSNDKSYNKIEQQARMANVGLWQTENPMAPWVWRDK